MKRATASKLTAQIHNRFDIEVIDGITGEIKQKAKAFNIICDSLWSRMITSGSVFATHIHYGSGSGTPSASDTSLFTFVGAIAATTTQRNVDYSAKVCSRTSYVQMGLSTAVGVTLTEIGMAYGTSSGNLTTHAMLQDMNGNPISIAKTDTDIINIYATIYCHWTEGNGIAIRITNTLLDILTGASNYIINGTCPLYLGKHNLNMNYFGASVSVSNVTRDISNKKISMTFSRMGENSGNINGLYFIDLLADWTPVGISLEQGSRTWSKFHMSNESVGVGDGVTTRFSTKFDFPENATVKVNGVAMATGVVVNKTPYSTDGTADGRSHFHFICIDPQSTPSHIIPCGIHYNGTGTGDGYPIQLSSSQTLLLYNPYATEGVGAYIIQGHGNFLGYDVYCSNDLENWTFLVNKGTVGTTADYTVPAAYRNYKYWKFVESEGYMGFGRIIESFDMNIVFDTAPMEGDVITVDYDTICIPKDSDHVVDFSIELQFGEYQSA